MLKLFLTHGSLLVPHKMDSDSRLDERTALQTLFCFFHGEQARRVSFPPSYTLNAGPLVVDLLNRSSDRGNHFAMSCLPRDGLRSQRW